MKEYKYLGVLEVDKINRGRGHEGMVYQGVQEEIESRIKIKFEWQE